MKQIFILMVGVFSICSTSLYAQQTTVVTNRLPEENITSAATSSNDVFANKPMQYLDDQTYNVRIYPNPSTDFVFIKSDDLVGKSYIIADMAGKQMGVSQVMNQNVVTLNVTEFPSGMYYARFEDGTVLRFIVRR